MQCMSCEAEISGKMRAALHGNVCPFCGAQIMDTKKARNYSSLVSILGKTQFTNRDDLDSKIKDKVLDLLVSNFEFYRLEDSQTNTEVVMIEDLERSASPEPRVAQPSPRPRTLTPRAGNIYEEMQNEIYQSDDVEDSPIAGDEEISEEELARYFQETTPADIRAKVEQRLQLAKQRAPSASGSGIKRLR